jgi:hypothetical protein
MFGREVNHPMELIYGDPNSEVCDLVDYISNLRQNIEYVHDFAREYMGKSSQRQKRKEYLVWPFTPLKRKGISPKLQRYCDVPLKLLKS